MRQNKPTSLNWAFAMILHLHVRNLHNGEWDVTQTNEQTEADMPHTSEPKVYNHNII